MDIRKNKGNRHYGDNRFYNVVKGKKCRQAFRKWRANERKRFAGPSRINRNKMKEEDAFQFSQHNSTRILLLSKSFIATFNLLISTVLNIHNNTINIKLYITLVNVLLN